MVHSGDAQGQPATSHARGHSLGERQRPRERLRGRPWRREAEGHLGVYSGGASLAVKREAIEKRVYPTDEGCRPLGFTGIQLRFLLLSFFAF